MIFHKLKSFGAGTIFGGFVVLSTIILAPSRKAFRTSGRASNYVLQWTTKLLLKTMMIENINMTYTPDAPDVSLAVVISNHVSFVDWFVIWACLWRLKPGLFLVFFAKRSLMLFASLFETINKNFIKILLLMRDINYDFLTIKGLEPIIKAKCDRPVFVVVFPEGTLITHKRSALVNLRRSLTRRVEKLNNVMIPKNTGFDNILKMVPGAKVIDVTLKYSHRTSIWTMLRGKRASVEVFVKVVDPPSADSFEWLYNNFKEKDARLSSTPFMDGFQGETYTINLFK
ncbi:hypothetical protein AV955_gp081 [Diadromus pulchellus ascovirus 4a]|uniref:Complete DpAV4 genome n=1 Tax=Diadromus pulchellus ascovirus 4a TaxID=158683 RepID=F2NZ10_9VIRU|nr:hypothetical protein AV955_gp081 [Diadromus pulchellus ascovirus 4a]CCA61438.1 unnamed protein product [Diadromus pulchellus ascovirus 4a]